MLFLKTRYVFILNFCTIFSDFLRSDKYFYKILGTYKFSLGYYFFQSKLIKLDDTWECPYFFVTSLNPFGKTFNFRHLFQGWLLGQDTKTHKYNFLPLFLSLCLFHFLPICFSLSLSPSMFKCRNKKMAIMYLEQSGMEIQL